MKQFLQNYVPAIKQLPLKKKYTKEELLTRDFLTINVQNYFQLISSYKIPVKKEKTLT